MLDKQEHFSYKIIVIGDAGIGKTSLSLRYTEKIFNQNSKYTIGIDYRSKYILIDQLKVKLNIFDTAGQQTFRSVAKNYYNQVDAVIFAYQIISKKSFHNVKNWLRQFQDNSNNRQSIKILVGTKCDQKQKRQVTEQQAKQFVQGNNFLFSFETSSKQNIRVDQVFQEIARNLLLKSFKQKKQNQEITKKDLSQMLGHPSQQQNQSKCC